MISGGRAGYDRLQVLARVRWPETAELLELVGVRSGMRCLDLGCGGGNVTLELARLVAPDGHVTGIDMDEEKLALARAEAESAGLENAEFRRVDVYEWSEPATYDLVYTRFLLEHLDRPLDVLVRMWAAVRPGGSLAVEDTDFDGLFCDPENDGFDFWSRVNPAVLERNGGDPRMGQKLFRLFLEAGIPDPRLRLTQEATTSGEAKTLPQLTLDATADAIVAAELASEEEIAAAVRSLAMFADDPTTVMGGPRVFQVWARKPD